MGCFWSRFALFLALAVSSGLRAGTVPLGVVFKGELTPLELTFVNKGKAAVHISQVSPSCDCIEVLQAPGDVPAGDTINIPLVHHAENTGTVEVTVSLLGDKSSEVIKTYTVAGFVADRSWLLSPREAQRSDLTFIDTRNPVQFSKLHMMNAINVMAFALRTRNDLRGSNLVLVDDGVSPVDLLVQAASLRQQGFNQVSVLSGGLPAWIRAGGRVEGANQSLLEVARISAADFARASRAAKWRVVAVGDVSIPAEVVAGVIKLGPADNIANALDSLARDATHGLPSNILVVAPGYGDYAKIEAQLDPAKPCPVFYLNGGAPALAEFRHEQIEASHHTGQVFKTALAPNGPVVAGGCSSCRH